MPDELYIQVSRILERILGETPDRYTVRRVVAEMRLETSAALSDD